MADMFDYTLESGEAARNILQNRVKILKNPVDYFLNSKIDQVYIFGSGTSYHACVACRYFMEKTLGVPVLVSSPLAFKDGEIIFNQNSAAVGLSQGGKSTSTIAALDKAKAAGLKTIASTASVDAEISRHAEAVMTWDIGTETVGPKTKGYIGAIVTNLCFAMQIALRKGLITATEEEALARRILKTVDNIPEIARRTDEWYKSQKEELKKARRIIVVGYENNIATALEGALKLMETVRYSVSGYELEEFLHGPIHSTGADDFMFYIGAQGRYLSRILTLKTYMEKRTGHGFVFSGDTAQDNKKNFIAGFIDDEEFSFLEYIVPFQVISCRLSADIGIDIYKPGDPEFNRTLGYKA
jgi:glucosamine 6-phosphate synthetase-like amidotransferase/phosphosugar isomerase protein